MFFKTVMEERKDIKGPSVTGFYVRIYLYLAGKMQINSSLYFHVSITFVLAYPT